MKRNKTIFFVGALALLLCSCNNASSSGLHTSTPTPSSTSSKEEGEVFNFYAINDFHGSILERMNGNYYEGGLEKVGGYLKAQKNADPDHTFIISSGDMWQGSLESNNNYGFLITEAMNYIGFDSMTLGNHDFDYGKSWLLANKEKADFPFLAANINMWDKGSGRPTEERWTETDNSVVIERGGRKIGIVGVIGYGQTTSITSKNVDDLNFADPRTYAEKEATKLRNAGCDIVILSIHSSVGTPSNWGGIKNYFDAVFGGHSHSEENKSTSDGVPMLQGASNGEYISHFKMVIDGNSNVKVTVSENIPANSNWSKDAGITSIMDKYIGTDEFKAMSERSCGTLNGSFTKTTIANAGCRAMYDKYIGTYPDLALTLENSQRAGVYPSSFTYSDLYKATPFTNNVVIAKFKGSDIKYEAAYNCTYTGDIERFGILEDNEYYTIAVIDYIAYHQDYNKNYDYFPSFKEENVLGEYETYPVDLTFEYFQKIGPNINSRDFAGTANGYGIYK